MLNFFGSPRAPPSARLLKSHKDIAGYGGARTAGRSVPYALSYNPADVCVKKPSHAGHDIVTSDPEPAVERAKINDARYLPARSKSEYCAPSKRVSGIKAGQFAESYIGVRTSRYFATKDIARPDDAFDRNGHVAGSVTFTNVVLSECATRCDWLRTEYLIG